ncbi:MAG TPA: EAL domain-containing protein [Methylocella sp.]|nr:EAL domain-containing protein [Methylocella sp.]
MRFSREFFGYGIIAIIGCGIAFAVYLDNERNFGAARAYYIETQKRTSARAAEEVRDAFTSIYENLRTLSLLPSVQTIDRRGLSLNENDRQTIQQIYNNLASRVAVSEVYIVPADLDPEKIDQATGQPEAPILMFDQLIVHDGKWAREEDPFAHSDEPNGDESPEIEIFEYRQIKSQLTWFKQHYNDRKEILGLKIPMISSPETITCDNTIYNKTKVDADRSGIVFSVPFYGPDQKLKGTISAIILTKALVTLLPRENYALVHSATHYLARSTIPAQAYDSNKWVEQGVKDPSLIYSEVIPVGANDSQGRWTLWAGAPNTEFDLSQEALNATKMGMLGYAFAAALTFGLFSCLYFVRRHIRVLRANEAEIGFLATHDALTGLPNRTALGEAMERLVSRARNGELLALLCLDLDRFKAVNDTLGHPIGDELLRVVTARLRESVRELDIIARLGGDEFVILQPNVGKIEEAEALAIRVIEVLTAPFELKGHQVIIGASVGIAIAPNDSENAEDLLRNADMALYRAKMDGRGCCRFFAPEMDARLRERRLLDLDLRHAVAAGEFVLHYQPLYDAASEKINCFEALLRWQHPKRGMVPPMDFIPLAEEIGIIVQIGEWVLRQACTDAAQWPGDIRVAVNLSPVQFKQASLPHVVASALADSGLLPRRLELEITESVLLHDSEANMAMLHALRALGVRIAMDDFGTGYSSLSYLRSFPFDKIKIDRSFVNDLASTRGDAATIIKAVAGLGTNLGMETTAEGVETEAQFMAVREQGCTQVQGYYFSRPLPREKVADLLASPAAATA